MMTTPARSFVTGQILSASYPSRRRWLETWLLPLVGLLMVGAATAALPAQEAEWIWSPEQQQGSVPIGSCYFRKTFNVKTADAAQLVIAADDSFEVRVNGRLVGNGSGSKRLVEYDIHSVPLTTLNLHQEFSTWPMWQNWQPML